MKQICAFMLMVSVLAPIPLWAAYESTGKAEDAAHSSGDVVVPSGTKRTDTAATSADTDGDYATLNTDATGRLWTNTELPDAAALADNTANPTVTSIAAYIMCFDGSTWDRCQGGLTDTDDGTIATSQVPSLGVGLGYVYDGTNWSRQTVGTAGTAAAQVSTVQGIASMTPLLTNPGTAANVGIYVEDAAETAGGNLAMAGAVQRNVAASSATSSGDNATLNVDTLGLLWSRQLDPCSGVAKVYYPINISTAATTEIVNGAGASTHIYICSLVLHTDAANDVALVEDDTDACASPVAGLAGGTTSGAGFQLAASSGLTIGNGQGSVMRTANQNYYLCIITSAATQLTGTLTYALAP